MVLAMNTFSSVRQDGNGTSVAPSVCCSALNSCALLNPVYPAPLSEMMRDSIDSYSNVISGIAPLLRKWNPLAVFRAVIAVYINSLNAVSVWCDTHVLKELVKRIIPFLAHGNPPAAVTIEHCIIRVVASGSHAKPSIVRLGLGESVCPYRRKSRLGLDASATRCMSSGEAIRRNANNLSAIAFAEPMLPTGNGRVAKDSQSREPKSGSIFESPMSAVRCKNQISFVIKASSHENGSFIQLVRKPGAATTASAFAL